jgi:NAD(P)-dependent dehydrogenase (short-subunit alcohol dehydrogenase family)
MTRERSESGEKGKTMAKVWLITGSARGLGRSLAEAVLARGDQLVATARNPQSLSDLAESYGENVRNVTLDVKNREQAHGAVKAAIETFGRLDVVVNNAGYSNLVSIEESTEEEFRDQIETNLWGVINVTRAALPVLRTQRSGHIVQISSIGGRIGGTPGFGAYLAAKYGVEGFSEVLAQEVKPLGIHVLIVEPGAMPTDWAGSSMHITQPGEDYQASVGQLLQSWASMGKEESPQWSDLAKVAQVILRMVDEPEPPLRLLIGSDAVQLAIATDEAKLAETHKWQAVSVSTDFNATKG